MPASVVKKSDCTNAFPLSKPTPTYCTQHTQGGSVEIGEGPAPFFRASGMLDTSVALALFAAVLSAYFRTLFPSIPVRLPSPAPCATFLTRGHRDCRVATVGSWWRRRVIWVSPTRLVILCSFCWGIWSSRCPSRSRGCLTTLPPLV